MKKITLTLLLCTLILSLSTPTKTHAIINLLDPTMGQNALKDNSLVGINAALAARYSDNYARLPAIEKFKDVNVRWTREDFNWQQLEPAKGQFKWGRTDQLVEFCDQESLYILGILSYSSEWASSAPADAPGTHEYYPPANLDDWKNYVTEVVKRYKNKIKHWQVWNEQDTGFWKPKPDAAAYASLLKTTYETIKSIDPEAVVVLGGINGNSKDYLQSLMDNGAVSYFDKLAVHPYTLASPENADLAGRLSGLNKIITTAGGKQKMWVTEMGWDTKPYSVDQPTQANYLVRFFTIAKSLPFLERIFWYDLKDDNPEGKNLNSVLRFGLLEYDYTPKPAYDALKTFQRYLQPTTYKSFVQHKLLKNLLLNDFEDPVSAPISLTTNTAVYGGGSGEFHYDFTQQKPDPKKTATPTAATTIYNQSTNIFGIPYSLNLWVKADKTLNLFFAEVQDTSGETFRYGITELSFNDWRYFTINFDKYISHTGGDGNGVIDVPLKQISLIAEAKDPKAQKGSFYIDQLSVTSEFWINEHRLETPDNGIISVIYRPNGVQQLDFPIPAESVKITAQAGETSAYTLPNKQLSLTFGPKPIYAEWTPTTYQSKWVSQSQGKGKDGAHQIKRGTTTTIEAVFANTGTTNWSNEGKEKVGFYVYKDLVYSQPLTFNNPATALFGKSLFSSSEWGSSADESVSSVRAGTLKEKTVAPGGNGTFIITLTAPKDAQTGIYREDFSLAHGPVWMTNLVNGDPIQISHVWIPVEIL